MGLVIANPREEGRRVVEQVDIGLRKRRMKPKASNGRGGKSLKKGTERAEVTASSPSITPPPTHRTVHFELHAPGAKEVYLAGSFEGWKPASLPLFRMDNGIWVKELVLEPGEYEYLFVVDGVWTPDPAAASVPNPFGGHNSRITVS
jgi:5'-AMP-activated protein kinase regulatory beta subunit